MKRQLMTGLFAALAFTAVAQSNEWRDPEVMAWWARMEPERLLYSIV